MSLSLVLAILVMLCVWGFSHALFRSFLTHKESALYWSTLTSLLSTFLLFFLISKFLPPGCVPILFYFGDGPTPPCNYPTLEGMNDFFLLISFVTVPAGFILAIYGAIKTGVGKKL